MIDNVPIFDATSNVQSIAADFVGGTHYQIIKVGWGLPNSILQVSENDPLPVQMTANGLTNGTSPHLNLTAAIAVTTIKGSPGILYQIDAFNPDGSDEAFLQIFDLNTIVVGTDTPVHTFRVGAGDQFTWQSVLGEKYSTSCRYLVTKESTGSNAPTTPLLINAEFA